MKILRIFVSFIFLLSAVILIYCKKEARKITGQGDFIIQNVNGSSFETKEIHRNKLKEIYPEIFVDDSLKSQGMLVMRIPEYAIVDSYCKVEDVANLLELSDYRIYEAGLVQDCIQEKVYLTLWGILFLALSHCVGWLSVQIQKSSQQLKTGLSQFYLSEIIHRHWKRMICKLLLCVGCVTLVGMIWRALTFFPLLPMSSDNFWMRLWDGLSGNALLPERFSDCIRFEYEQLWTLNKLTNVAFLLLYICLIFSFLDAIKYWYQRRKNQNEDCDH